MSMTEKTLNILLKDKPDKIEFVIYKDGEFRTRTSVKEDLLLTDLEFESDKYELMSCKCLLIALSLAFFQSQFLAYSWWSYPVMLLGLLFLGMSFRYLGLFWAQERLSKALKRRLKEREKKDE